MGVGDGPVLILCIVLTAVLVGVMFLWSGHVVHARRMRRVEPILPTYAAMGLTTAVGYLDVASIRGVPRPPAFKHLPVRLPSVGVVDGARVAVFETFQTVPGSRIGYLPQFQDRIERVAAFVDAPLTVPADITLAAWFLGRTPRTLAVNPDVPGQMAAVAGGGWSNDDEARRAVETLLTQEVRIWLDRLPRRVLTISLSGSTICGSLRWAQVLPAGAFDGPDLVRALLDLRRMVPPDLIARYPLRDPPAS